jgi:hypothetical protein
LSVVHQVDAWLPIRTTCFDDVVFAEIVDRHIAEFLQSLSTVLPLLFKEVSDVSVSADSPASSLMAYLSRNSSLVNGSLFRVIKIAARVEFQDQPIDPEPSEESSEAYRLSIAGYYLSEALNLALQLSELSNPGCIWAAAGAVTVENQIVATVDEKLFLSTLHPRVASTNSWPQVLELPLKSVVDWSIACGLLRSPLATTRIQRTLASFTHVVGLARSRDGETLFRAMQGLEAFYCDGVGDLRRQLSEKSRIWLGPNIEKANVVGQLYDLRSQYVHGAAKLQYWHDIHDPWEADPKTMTKFSEGIDFAVRILVATLQKCIQENAQDVSWSFTHAIERAEEA